MYMDSEHISIYIGKGMLEFCYLCLGPLLQYCWLVV